MPSGSPKLHGVGDVRTRYIELDEEVLVDVLTIGGAEDEGLVVTAGDEVVIAEDDVDELGGDGVAMLLLAEL